MKLWAQLYQQHGDSRRADPKGTALAEIRSRLKKLADLGHCDGSIVGRFNAVKNKDRRHWSLKTRDGAEDEPLKALPELVNASLTVLAIEHSRTNHLHQFTAILEGTAENDRPLLVAVHFESDLGDEGDRKGEGACGHAAFHCHVGPDFESLPKVRVPLPAIGPLEALDWLLSIVVPGWEPATWEEILKLNNATKPNSGTQKSP